MKSAVASGAFPDVADVTGTALVAHQGGWDEILLVVGPLAVVAGLLWLANKRVSAQLEAAQADGSSAEPDAGGDGDGGDEGSPGPHPAA